MEKIYLVGKNGIFPIAEAANIDELFKKIVSGETMERGFGSFEVMEARRVVCFKLAEHLKRLFSNLKTCRIKIPYSADELSLFIANALENAGLEESILRLDVILGEEGEKEPLFLLIKIRPKKEKKPLALKTFEFSRTMPNLKVSGGYVYAQMTKRLFPDYDDVLYAARDDRGRYFMETSRGNFFAMLWFDTIGEISGKHIVYGAKSSSILKGITRQTLLEANSKFSGEFIFRDDKKIYYDDLKFVKEAFITSSSNRIIPVRKIDDYVLDTVDDGRGGPITRRLSILFDAYVDEYYRKNT
ncbi:MAG: aminotransferase class IV [Patescibacteria group bacterium]